MVLPGRIELPLIPYQRIVLPLSLRQQCFTSRHPLFNDVERVLFIFIWHLRPILYFHQSSSTPYTELCVGVNVTNMNARRF